MSKQRARSTANPESKARIGAKTLYDLYTLMDLTFEEIAEQYPTITAEDVETAVDYMEKQDEDKAPVIA